MIDKIKSLLNSDMSLKSKRDMLSMNSHNPEAFPGSAAWREAEEWRKALNAFDAEHPEIIAAIKAAKQAKRDAMLADKDVLGL